MPELRTLNLEELHHAYAVVGNLPPHVQGTMMNEANQLATEIVKAVLVLVQPNLS